MTAKMRPDPALLPFRRERILAAGTLLALGPIPLAFGDSLHPSVLLVYLAALGVLLGFVRAGKVPCLADRWLNLAGLAYFALFWFGFRFGGRSLLRTALHILLFTAVLKLASIKRERDFSVAMTLAAFLLVASMATSTHATILLYLAAYAAVAWPLFSRWALWRDLAAAPDEWRGDERAREIPSRRAVAASLAASFVLAVPMFILLPRLKSTYIQGLPGGDTADTGFSDTVDVNLYGRLRQSDKVFLRVAVEEGPVSDDPPFLKIRLVAHTRFAGGVWKKPDGHGRVVVMREGSRLPLRPPGSEAAEPLHRLSFEIAPLGVRFLPYPVTAISGAASPELLRRYGAVPLVRDGDGNLHLTFEPPRLFRVEVLSGPKPAVDLAPPADLDPSREAMGSETLRAFGRNAAGGIDPAASPYLFASRIADHLASRFFYSVDSARWGPSPVEEFLTRRKSGHCETFATAMALVLREHGIPSRLVTGFAGGERGPFGSYYLVRGLDAHAWVEAWCGPGYGWIAFDPTPPAGRPGVTRVNLLRSAGQLFENLEFLYGRYVLGFAQADQASLAQSVREGFAAASEKARGVLEAIRAFVRGGSRQHVLLVLLTAAAAGAAVFLLRRFAVGTAVFGTRGLPPASAAYRTLQRVLRRQGADLSPASAPSETLASADQLGAGRISREIVGAYVAESFGGRPTPEVEALRLGELLKELRARRPK
jgi:transglutaminase-like putative cysteine protease